MLRRRPSGAFYSQRWAGDGVGVSVSVSVALPAEPRICRYPASVTLTTTNLPALPLARAFWRSPDSPSSVGEFTLAPLIRLHSFVSHPQRMWRWQLSGMSSAVYPYASVEIRPKSITIDDEVSSLTIRNSIFDSGTSMISRAPFRC